MAVTDSLIGWQSSDKGVSGKRSPGGIMPMACNAHLTGMGLDSTNRSLCNARKDPSRASALSRSPHRAAAHISCMARGATLAVTEISPFAPSRINSIAVASSPLYRSSRSPQRSRISLPRARSPVASLMPTILLIGASRSTVSGNRSHRVRPGTLYRIWAIGTASATAL